MRFEPIHIVLLLVVLLVILLVVAAIVGLVLLIVRLARGPRDKRVEPNRRE